MNILLVGDIALNGLFVEESDKNYKRFKNVIPLFRKSDLVFANLETPLQGYGQPNELKILKNGIIHYTTFEVLREILPLLNISAVSLANNHIYDFKTDGLIETIKLLDNLNIRYTGAGLTEKDISPVYIKNNNVNVGFMAYVDRSTNPIIPSNSKIKINYYDEEIIIQKIKKVKKNCDYLILSLHWGLDYSSFSTHKQIISARKFIKCGVDIIMGHHVHTIQMFENINDKFIFYSLGGLCFGDFIKEGKLRSLKLKTRNSIIPIINIFNKNLKTYKIKELQGNYLKIIKQEYRTENNFLRYLTILKLNNKFIDFLLDTKEIFLDRIIDYFFGYYRNPIIQLFSLMNLKKIIFFYDDYKRMKRK